MAKILKFPHNHYKRKRKSPLSKLMIEALLSACADQNKGIPFGPIDNNRSFSALIERGLITKKKLSWHVTKEAYDILTNMGFEIPC
jgi:hypothetical protein